VRRLRPLAQQTVDAELARAMRLFATRHLHHHLGADTPLTPDEPPAAAHRVELPPGTISAVRRLVGAQNVSAFIAAAAEREVQSRTLDALASPDSRNRQVDQIG